LRDEVKRKEKTTILSCVLYGCETWFLTREECVRDEAAEENI